MRGLSRMCVCFVAQNLIFIANAVGASDIPHCFIYQPNLRHNVWPVQVLPLQICRNPPQPRWSSQLGSDPIQISRRQTLATCLVAWWLSTSQASKAQEAVADQASLIAAEKSAQYPSEQQIENVRRGFRAFDSKNLKEAEALFSKSIVIWEDLKRPRDELAELYKVRGNIRVDLKQFIAAKSDYDHVLTLMYDGEKSDGTAAYMEYPDTYVQRGLCCEGLAEWANAVQDYSKAIQLWGGGRGEGINPYVLTFRANSLGRMGRYKEALQDYRAAEALFLSRRDEERAVDCRANAALATYAMGDTAVAAQMMREIVRRRPGYADMHVALAAHAWGRGAAAEAESEWQLACDQISVGCRLYRDPQWVATVRRWPPPLADRLALFLSKTLPTPAVSP